MLKISELLDLDRCPHCRVHKPTLTRLWGPNETRTHADTNPRWWGLYRCNSCGGCVIAGGAKQGDGHPNKTSVDEVYPGIDGVDEAIPELPRSYLLQARDSIHAPDGAGMLAASAVDAMLKAKGYTKGWINKRINEAVKDHLITVDMGKWAHQVRIDSNDPRHADKERPHLTENDAKRSIKFASALAQLLFVLPALIDEGIKASDEPPAEDND